MPLADLYSAGKSTVRSWDVPPPTNLPSDSVLDMIGINVRVLTVQLKR